MFLIPSGGSSQLYYLGDKILVSKYQRKGNMIAQLLGNPYIFIFGFYVIVTADAQLSGCKETHFFHESEIQSNPNAIS